jgi:transposase
MITEQGLSISHVSQTMDIGVTAIRRWMEQYEAEQQGQPGIGKLICYGRTGQLSR